MYIYLELVGKSSTGSFFYKVSRGYKTNFLCDAKRPQMDVKNLLRVELFWFLEQVFWIHSNSSSKRDFKLPAYTRELYSIFGRIYLAVVNSKEISWSKICTSCTVLKTETLESSFYNLKNRFISGNITAHIVFVKRTAMVCAYFYSYKQHWFTSIEIDSVGTTPFQYFPGVII